MLHVLSFICHFVVYWVMSIIFIILDYINNRHTKETLDIATEVLENQLLLDLPLVVIADMYYPLTNQLDLIHFVWQIPCLFIIHDILFYYLHRMMHTRTLYKYHKTHHALKNISGVSAFRSSKTEHILVNILPAYLTPIFLRFHGILLLLWITAATINVVCVHSGYGLFDKKHEAHHKYLNVNYGLGIYMCDRLFNTYLST